MEDSNTSSPGSVGLDSQQEGVGHIWFGSRRVWQHASEAHSDSAKMEKQAETFVYNLKIEYSRTVDEINSECIQLSIAYTNVA